MAELEHAIEITVESKALRDINTRLSRLEAQIKELTSQAFVSEDADTLREINGKLAETVVQLQAERNDVQCRLKQSEESVLQMAQKISTLQYHLTKEYQNENRLYGFRCQSCGYESPDYDTSEKRDEASTAHRDGCEAEKRQEQDAELGSLLRGLPFEHSITKDIGAWEYRRGRMAGMVDVCMSIESLTDCMQNRQGKKRQPVPVRDVMPVAATTEADAELGVLVRDMKPGMMLRRGSGEHCAEAEWYIQHCRKISFMAADTPEEVLRLAPKLDDPFDAKKGHQLIKAMQSFAKTDARGEHHD